MAAAARPLSDLSTAPKDEDDWQWLPSTFVRLLSAFGMAHIVTEYGADLTLCSGPSMLPTLKTEGEIILVDRLTPRLCGIEGGCVGRDRVKLARQRQDEYKDANPDTQEDSRWHQVMIPANRLPADRQMEALLVTHDDRYQCGRCRCCTTSTETWNSL